jgi:hypothetical protein
MYLRHTEVRKGGRAHTYWRVVRSVRRGGKVVQETVAQLGELDAEGRASARLLAQQLLGGARQGELFEAPVGGEQRITVCPNRVRIERGRAFGAVWLGWTLWRALKLDQLCDGADASRSGRKGENRKKGTGDRDQEQPPTRKASSM